MSMDELEDLFNDEPVITNVETVEEVISEDLNDDFFGDLDRATPAENKEDSIISDILTSKGIVNNTIKIIDENNVESEVNFYDLPKEEQLEILMSSEENVKEEILDENEIQFINYLRTENVSLDDFLESYKQSILAEVQAAAPAATYDIDNYTDEELFLLDLQTKFELTDEELQIELRKELDNPDLFTKKTAKLRTDYKLLEDQYKETLALEAANKRDEDYNKFSDSMLNIATTIDNFHGIYLEDDEKNETLAYLLTLDETGVSQFAKDINDPQKLYEAAWYMRYGKEAFEALESAYEAEIAELKKNQKVKDKPQVVVLNPKKTQSIHDLF